MKVKELIKELSKMSPNLIVGIAVHDNRSWEISGYPCSVVHHIKTEYEDEVETCYDPDSRAIFEDSPKEWVTIHC